MILSNFIEILRFPFRDDKPLRRELKNILGYYPDNIEYYRLALSHKSAVRRTSNGKCVNNERLEFLGDAILDAIVGDIVYEHFPGKPEGFLTNTQSKLLEWSQKNRIRIKFNLIEQKADADASPVFKYEVVLEDRIKGATGTGYSKKESQQAAAKGTLQMLRRDVNMLDSVFAAKADRTKMEEEPVMSLPEIGESKSEEAKPAKSERREKPEQQRKKEKKEEKAETDEFDLSDIRMKRMSHEDIIAAAEEAAWNEE